MKRKKTTMYVDVNQKMWTERLIRFINISPRPTTQEVS